MFCRAAATRGPSLRCHWKPHPSPRRRCSSTSRPASPARSHARLIKAGVAADVSAWNAVLTAYGKCSGLADARKLFDEIPTRDTASWNALISAHVARGKHMAAREIFGYMMWRGFAVDAYTVGSILKCIACDGRLESGKRLHSLVVKVGLDEDVYAGSALVDMYVKCSRISDAELMFGLMPARNVVSWNAVIAGHAQAGHCCEAFRLFDRMEQESMFPDEATFASILTLLDTPELYNVLLQVHAKIIKYGWAVDTIACNAAITSYSECGSISDAEKIFGDMEGIRDLVTWNSMLAAYAFDGLAARALVLFTQMMEVGMKQDMYTFTSVISVCFDKEQGVQGRALHGLGIKKGLDCAIPVSNSLIGMYIKSSDRCTIEDAMKCFELMEFKDNVSWNAILTGLSQNSHSEEAMNFFRKMQTAHLKIDHFTFSAALRSCADLAVLELGMQVHGAVIKSGYRANDFVVSSLIHMYSRSGAICEAQRAFDESNRDNLVTWNSIIFAYAQHGHGHIALDLFVEMQGLQVAPDHITFVGILSACSHIGLVEEGTRILQTMESVHGVQLRMEHYACGVDLYGRAGRLDAARRLIMSMPFEPDAMVWMTLLGACRIHGDVELASEVAHRLMELEPKEHSTYVLLANMYSNMKMWEGRAVVQRAMRERGVSKVPGWSWIEVNNKVHAFNAEDRSHSQAEQIYERLTELMEEIGRIGCDVDAELAAQN